jgi:hypothetical protein
MIPTWTSVSMDRSLGCDAETLWLSDSSQCDPWRFRDVVQHCYSPEAQSLSQKVADSEYLGSTDRSINTQVHGLLFFFFLIRTRYSQLTADRPHGIEGSGTYTAASIITTTMSQSTQEMTAWAVFASERKGGAKSEWLQYFMGTTSEPRNNQRVGVGISTKKKNMENEYGPYILYLGRDMILTLSLDKGAETGLEVHLFSGVGRDARSIEWTCEKCNCHKQGDKDNADHANGLSITPDKLVGAEFWDKQLKKWINGLESSRQRAGSAPSSQHPPPQQKARNPGQPNAPYLAPPPGSQWRGPATMQFQYPHQAYGQALNPHQAYGQALNPHQTYG